jgi:hypothetical protein
MGGPGSGFYIRWSTKSTTESQHRVDIRYLKQQGLLRPGAAGTLSWSSRGKKTGSIGYRMYADYMVLYYRHRPRDEDWEDIQQIIHFDRTSCHYGGYRTWLLCPRCGKRVAVLYGAGKYFWCRHCYNLTYTCQQESKIFRLMSTAQKIRERLGGSPNLSEIFPEKPKNMHWKTYRRLRFESELANTLSWELAGQRIGITGRNF